MTFQLRVCVRGAHRSRTLGEYHVEMTPIVPDRSDSNENAEILWMSVVLVPIPMGQVLYWWKQISPDSVTA